MFFLTLTDQNIESLLDGCKKGHQLAQMEVYNRYQAAMYNIALRIVKNSAEAEDVMQDSFLAAFTKLDSFKGDAPFGAWLKRIVVNKSIVQYKKSLRFIPYEDEILKNETEEIIGFDIEDYAEIKASKVLKCIEQLNNNYRHIITLHFIEGYDYEELCEILNITNQNCRTLISRAKESLRQKLNSTQWEMTT